MNEIYLNSFIFPEDGNFEAVERKGVGHPDTVADAVAEKVSVEYSEYCLKNFGVVLHHNVDKIGVLGGMVKINWGSSSMVRPVRALLTGRISRSFAGKEIPVRDIAEKAILEQLTKALPMLDTNQWLQIIDLSTAYSRNENWFNPRGIEDLPEQRRAFANDTSAVVSYWPLTTAEKLTLSLEGFFYKGPGKPRFKEYGGDIKVMTIRNDDSYQVTLCVPFFSEFVSSESEYWKMITALEKELLDYAQKLVPASSKITLVVNPHDQIKKGGEGNHANSFYMVAAGGALDYGEEGFVGRGNNRLGIISSVRPYTMEAAQGKNPVYHTGKVLGVVADTLAREIAEKLSLRVEVWIITKNADPLFTPSNIVIKTSDNGNKEEIEKIKKDVLSRRDWTERIIGEELLIPIPGQGLVYPVFR